MTVDYIGEIKQAIKRNKELVLKEIDSEKMTLKIANWANRFDYSFDVIKQKILDDEIFRCVFIKDPIKQNICQKLAAKYITSLDFVENFQSLPAGGKKALYLVNGKLFSGKELGRRAKDTKSIDFSWKIGERTFYATHKYTGISGGSQDNQYNDVQTFLKNARDCNDENVIFLAICDGDYYLKKDSSTGDATKIKRLQRLTDRQTAFVVNINNIKSFLIDKFCNC